MEGANLNFNDMDFDLSFASEYAQPAAQMPMQPFMKSAEGDTSDFLLFPGDEGIDTSGGAFIGSGAAQQSFDSMTTDLFSFPQDAGFGLQQNLNMDNTMGTSWNNQLPSAINDFSPTSTHTQAFVPSQFAGSVQKRPLQLDTQDFPQPKRQERAEFAATFSPFAPSTSVTGSSWTVETQPTPTSSNEVGLSDEAADVCATWFSKYGMLPGDRHIESLSQLTDESPTAIRHWFGQMLKQGMSGHDSAYKSQTRLTQQDQPTSTSTGWIEASSTQVCNNDTTTTAGQSALRGGKKGCTRTDKHELLCRDPNKIYQCTRKCGKRYGRKCDWKRNEEEGYPSKSWQCSLCVSQGVEKVKPCFRRYHFSQHFRNIHPGLNSADYEETSVVHSDTTFPRKCGFCTHRFTSRQDRIDHIADHFKKGKCMLDWVDDDDNNDSDDLDDDDDRPDSDGFDSNSPSTSPQGKNYQDRPGQRRNGGSGRSSSSSEGGNQQGGGLYQLPAGYSKFHRSESYVNSQSEVNDEITLPTNAMDVTPGMTHNNKKAIKQHVRPAEQRIISSTTDKCAEERIQLLEESVIDSQHQSEASTVEDTWCKSLPSPLGSCSPRSSISGNNAAAGNDKIAVAGDAFAVTNIARMALSSSPATSTLRDLGGEVPFCDRAKKPEGSTLDSPPVTDRPEYVSRSCPEQAHDQGFDGVAPLARTDAPQCSQEPSSASLQHPVELMKVLNQTSFTLQSLARQCSSTSHILDKSGCHRDPVTGTIPVPLDEVPPNITSELDSLPRPPLEPTSSMSENVATASNLISSSKSSWREINDNFLDLSNSWEQSFTSVKLLGAGGFSTVDEVVHRETNLRVSRKTLKNRNASAKKELMKEVDVLQRLRHPHIVRFLGAYAKGDKVSVLLSPVAETTLAVWLEKSSAKKPDGLADVVAKMYGCLSSTIRYLHEQRPVIKHMDIKPQNILVMYGDSEHPHVVLSDFGVSSADDDSEGPHSKPVTRQYCAPEVPEDAVRGQAADIWSLGCVFLEMAAAVLTQHNQLWQELRQEFRGTGGKCYWEDVPRLQEYLSGFISHAPAPQDFITLCTIRSMLNRNPTDRPDAAQLTIIFTPGACCLQWPNEMAAFPGPLEELDTLEMLIREENVDSLAQLDRHSGIELRREPQAFSQVKSWLDECSHEHESCRQSSNPHSLPTRLIDSQPTDTDGSIVRVINSSEAVNDESSGRVEYVVLNHLWSQTDMTLSSDRLRDGQGLLRRQALPKAVNDAVTAANRIGFRYIWVDSLCVLQDSEQEKRRECTSMASVYRNAALTIVVDKVNSSPVASASRNTLPFGGDISLMQWNATGFAWDTRAWSLQERLLSHRLLHLAGEQMYWECNSLKASETFPRGLPPLIWEKVHTKSSEPREQGDGRAQVSCGCKNELKKRCNSIKHGEDPFDLGPSTKQEHGGQVDGLHSPKDDQNVKSKIPKIGNMKLGSPNTGGEGLRNSENAFSPHVDLVKTLLASRNSTPVSPWIHSNQSGHTEYKLSDIWAKERTSSEGVRKARLGLISPAEADVSSLIVEGFLHRSEEEIVNADMVMKVDDGLEVGLVKGDDAHVAGNGSEYGNAPMESKCHIKRLCVDGSSEYGSKI